MVREGEHHLRYDANGRMVEKTRHQNGFRPQTTQYEWDETDRLIRVQLPNGEAWCYQYDVLGRRCRKYRQSPSEAHYQSHKPRDIHYLWQGDQLSQQQSHYVDGRIVTTQWVYEPGSFRPLAQIRQLDTVNKTGELERGKPELHYAITDMAGNVKELCDPQGQVQWRSEQGLWQALYQWRLERLPKQYLEEAILDPLHCDLRHQGQIVDEETGLYYNRHRYYDPQICQYLSPDPIGLAGGIRPQAYVHNPLEWVDPLGLSGCPEVGATTVVDINPSKTISGRKIINSHLAGTIVKTKGGDIRFDNDGFPDFTPYSQKTVRIEGLTGEMTHDVALAMKKAGITTYDKSKYVWHHHQDARTMMLVPKNVHSVKYGGVAHTGGRAVIQHNLNNPNNMLHYLSPEELF